MLSVGRDQVQERYDASRTKVSAWIGGPFHPFSGIIIVELCKYNYVFRAIPGPNRIQN